MGCAVLKAGILSKAGFRTEAVAHFAGLHSHRPLLLLRSSIFNLHRCPSAAARVRPWVPNAIGETPNQDEPIRLEYPRLAHSGSSGKPRLYWVCTILLLPMGIFGNMVIIMRRICSAH